MLRAMQLLALSVLASIAYGQTPPTISRVSPLTAKRGEPVTLEGEGFSAEMEIYLKRLDAKDPVGKPIAPLEVASDKSATFLVPQASFGSYFVGVKPHDSSVVKYANLTNALKIVSAVPHIDSVVSDPAYPQGHGYKVRILGTGLSDVPDDNTLVIAGQRLEKCDTAKPCATATKTTPRELAFTIRDDGEFYGRHKVPISVIVDDKESNRIDIRLSRVWMGVPLGTALFGVILIILLLVFLSSVLKSDPGAGHAHSRWDMFFLDPETDTYSLSKLQFYAWTFATVFGYLYLATARGLVQGVLDFNDIPEGLPAVLGISAATSALAIGVTNVRGSKGAGDVGPSRADFLTTGGVVAADRVQFLVWTVVGVATFLLLVVMRDPGTIADLPAVPQGFLLLMGVSSAGYLGGKLARKPGPNVTDLKVTQTAAAPPAAATVKLEVTGEHFSKNAKLLIDNEELSASDYATGGEPKFSGGTDPEFATNVTLVVKNDKGGNVRWPPGTHNLIIVNPDGQRAVKEIVLV